MIFLRKKKKKGLHVRERSLVEHIWHLACVTPMADLFDLTGKQPWGAYLQLRASVAVNLAHPAHRLGCTQLLHCSNVRS